MGRVRGGFLEEVIHSGLKGRKSNALQRGLGALEIRVVEKSRAQSVEQATQGRKLLAGQEDSGGQGSPARVHLDVNASACEMSVWVRESGFEACTDQAASGCLRGAASMAGP